MSAQYLIWSNEHRAWWGPNSRGYTPSVHKAGRYDRDFALNICRNANFVPTSSPNEIIILEADALECFGGSNDGK